MKKRKRILKGILAAFTIILCYGILPIYSFAEPAIDKSTALANVNSYSYTAEFTSNVDTSASPYTIIKGKYAYYQANINEDGLDIAGTYWEITRANGSQASFDYVNKGGALLTDTLGTYTFKLKKIKLKASDNSWSFDDWVELTNGPSISVNCINDPGSTPPGPTPDPSPEPAPDQGSQERQNYITPLEDTLTGLIETITKNLSSETATTPQLVSWDKGNALPLNVMEQLKSVSNVSLLFSFEYEEEKHQVMIPAGASFVDENIPWYGPLWLLDRYGEYNLEAQPSGKYEVKSGESLKSIAEKNGLTLEYLIKKNPQIENINLIYPGDIINL